MRKSTMTIATVLLLAAPLWAERGLHRYGLAQVPHSIGKPMTEPECYRINPEQRSGTGTDGAKIIGCTEKNGFPKSTARDPADSSTVCPEARAY